MSERRGMKNTRLSKQEWQANPEQITEGYMDNP